ncbi:cyclase family protein [Myxococcota bacterium]|nr:cyclase family protein [Myxococcota bacterium]
MSPIYDISIPLNDKTLVYPGDPPFVRERTSDLEQGAPFNFSHISCGLHTGTHLDMPAHFIREGDTALDIDISRWILPALVVNTGEAREITAELIASILMEPGDALLFQTRNSKRGLLRGTTVPDDYTALTPEAARLCVELKCSLVGIDWLTVDLAGDQEYGAHRSLLGARIPILECIDLSGVPVGRYTLVALPLPLEGAEASLSRAILLSPASLALNHHS